MNTKPAFTGERSVYHWHAKDVQKLPKFKICLIYADNG